VRRDSQIEAELGHGLEAIERGARDALAEPPSAEVAAGQPRRRDMVVHLHGRNVQAAKPRGARADEQLGHFLSEQQPSVRPSEVGVERSGGGEEFALRRHVRAERDLARLLVDEGAIAVILDRDRRPRCQARA
jgi:hypothetical protein